MKISLFIKLFLVFGWMSIINKQEDLMEYDLKNPKQIFELPEILQEVSGVTDLTHNKIACVQDEKGIIFIIDLTTGKITNQFEFGEDGDYEGITRFNRTLYILRSDGVLIEVLNPGSKKMKKSFYETKIPAKNNEGLCYDSLHQRLLIGCKSKSGKGSEYKEIRSIYSFDLKSKKLSEKPVFELKIEEVAKYAKSKGIQLPKKIKKKTGEVIENLRLGISAIAIHPVSGDLYLLSAVDHLFMIFNSKGEIQFITNLSKDLYPQAEGITFLENGNMIITSEGKEGKASLLIFTRSKD
ncbi:MAG: SdiA-regulated domain-containing protein [Vicingus serpentipes]|nr:SdiA-regulated domain-containing protein [Vicingus serpentipes]